MRGRAPFPATWWTQPSSDRAQHLRLGPRGERHGPTAPGSRSRGSGGGCLLRVDMRTETKRKQVSGVVRDALAGHAATSESKGEPRPAAGVGATDRCRRRSLWPWWPGSLAAWLAEPQSRHPPPPLSVLDVFVFSCFSVPVPQFFRSLVGILGLCSRQSSRSGAGHGSLPLALASARPFLPSRLSPSFHSSPFGRFPNHSFNPCLALLVGD